MWGMFRIPHIPKPLSTKAFPKKMWGMRDFLAILGSFLSVRTFSAQTKGSYEEKTAFWFLSDRIRRFGFGKRGGKRISRSKGRMEVGTDAIGIGAILIFSGNWSVAGREDECRWAETQDAQQLSESATIEKPLLHIVCKITKYFRNIQILAHLSIPLLKIFHREESVVLYNQLISSAF